MLAVWDIASSSRWSPPSPFTTRPTPTASFFAFFYRESRIRAAASSQYILAFYRYESSSVVQGKLLIDGDFLQPARGDQTELTFFAPSFPSLEANHNSLKNSSMSSVDHSSLRILSSVIGWM